MEKNKGAATPLQDARPLPSLQDLGIDYTQSSRWQLEASIPEEKFQKVVRTRELFEANLRGTGIPPDGKSPSESNRSALFSAGVL